MYAELGGNFAVRGMVVEVATGDKLLALGEALNDALNHPGGCLRQEG